MARSNADLLALKDELTNDPNSLGLTLTPADDAANADLLNEVLATQQVDRESLSATEVIKSIDVDEFVGLSVGHRQYIQMLATLSSIDPSGGNEVREGLLQMFGAGTETRANIQSILTESASRITQMYKDGLLDQGGNVTPSDISQARQAV